MILFDTPNLNSLRDPLVERARALARRAHDRLGQKRDYFDLPYWSHSENVAERYLQVSTAETTSRRAVVVAAALCHDVLERVTPEAPEISRAMLHEELGAEVTHYVDELSNRYGEETNPGVERLKRKRWEGERLAFVSPIAKTVKLADIVENLSDTQAHDPGLWPSYRDEKRLAIPGLGADIVGNAALFELAKRIAGMH